MHHVFVRQKWTLDLDTNKEGGGLSTLDLLLFPSFDVLATSLSLSLCVSYLRHLSSF